MANRSKAKGYRGEVEVIEILQTIVNEEYSRRGLKGPELSRSPHGRDIVGLAWLAPEVKRVEADNPANVASWWAQAKSQATRGIKPGHPPREPVLFYRQNNRPWNVRLFGYLVLPELPNPCPTVFANGIQYPVQGPRSQRVRCPVDTSLEAFTAYLRMRIQQDLATPVTSL